MTNIGSLVTRVFTSRTQLPISNATVSIVQRNEENKYDLLAVRITDQNGKTAPVAIETPDIMESLSPDNPTSYALVDVWVEHPEYQLMEIRDVQVFPEIESIQEIPMLPLSRSQSNFIHNETVTITPQEL